MTGKRPSILDTHPHLEGFVGFLDDFNKETERGAALAAAAMLDDLLGRTVQSFLIENKGSSALLEGFNAPLGSLASRAAACLALGLISEAEYQDCELVRKIRNEFAHQVKVSFASDKISGMCSAFQMSAKDYGDVKLDARGKFTTAAVALILLLTNRPHYVSLKRLAQRQWEF